MELSVKKSVVQSPSQGLERDDEINVVHSNVPAPAASGTSESCAAAPSKPIIQQAHSCLSMNLSMKTSVVQSPSQGLERDDEINVVHLNVSAPAAKGTPELGSAAAPSNPIAQKEHLNYPQEADPHLNHPQQPSLHQPQQPRLCLYYPQQAQSSVRRPQQAHLPLNHPQRALALLIYPEGTFLPLESQEAHSRLSHPQPVHLRLNYSQQVHPQVNDPQQVHPRLNRLQQAPPRLNQPDQPDVQILDSPRQNQKCTSSCGLDEPEILQALLCKSIHLGENLRLGKSSCERICLKSLQLILKSYYKACSKINVNVKNVLASKNLLDPNVNINISEKFLKKFRPLHFAVKYQLLDEIKILLENGIDVNATDSKGLTALHYAVQDTQMGLLEEDHLEIRMTNIDLDGQKNCASMFFRRLFKVIILLVKSGSDVNARDRFGRTPMFYLYNRLCERAESKVSDSAEERPTMCSYHYLRMVNYFSVYAHKSTVQLLTSRRLDFGVRDRDGNTILHLLAKAGDLFWKYSDASLVKAYVKSGGDVNALNQHGYTALHYACGNNFTELVKALLRYGADVNLTRTVNLERPIHRAVLFLRHPHCRPGCTGQYKLVERLLRHGADVDAETTGGLTPVLMATDLPPGVQNRPLLHCLLSWGCDVNRADHLLGETPLHHLCRNGHVDMMDAFLQRGADVNALDHRGETPFTLACKANELGFGAILMYAYMTRLVLIGPSSLCQTNLANYTRYREMIHQKNASGKTREMRRLAALLTSERRCRAEQELMRTVRVDRYASLYDVLVADWRHLVPRATGDGLAGVVCDQHFDEDYAMYGHLIRHKLARARRRAALLEPAREALKAILEVGLPDSVHDEVLKHVDNRDLVNLVRATEKSKRKSSCADPKLERSLTSQCGDVKRPRLE